MRSVIVLTFLCCALSGNTQVTIIPQPVDLVEGRGSFLLKEKITISNSLPAHEWQKLYAYLKDELKRQFNIAATEAAKGQKGDIDFFMTRMPTSGKPAYKLSVNKEGIRVQSNFGEPTFHAMQTIFQLIPLSGEKHIPFVEIFDHARFDYRGMHLDVSRHFFPVSFIKRYIDYLAYHKLNKFHWHLTDDQGWRIEIKKYPKLTSTGAWRNGTITGRYPGTGNDGKKYGGYYTQAEVKEVVKYAADRFITVVPEIEMPGHASAAIAAYPELSCFPNEPTTSYFPKECKWSGTTAGKQVQQTWGVFDDVFCAGKETTFLFLEDVLKEVMALFPSKYIHVGGDECPKINWKKCPSCQERMKKNKLKDEHELQSYFIQRMEKYLNVNGRTLIGWDEILEGGLAPNAVVMSWRGEQGGIDAAKQKHTVIMTPGNPVYFDHSQSENEDSVTIGSFNPIEKVYHYEPIPKELNEEEAKYVLGAQANLWTEYIRNTKKVEYMLFPRLSALSEVLWSSKEQRNWDLFQKKLLQQFKRYDHWKANYSVSFFDLKASVIPNAAGNGIALSVESKVPGEQILFHNYPALDTNCMEAKRKNPTDTLCVICLEKTPYLKEINCSGVYGYTLVGKGVNTTLVTQEFHLNKATGKKITLTQIPSAKYPGDGPFTLVNGVINTKGTAKSNEFLGFEGADCEAIIDLGKGEAIKSITINFLDQRRSWIYPPGIITILLSNDGINFSQSPNEDRAKEIPGQIQRNMTAGFYRPTTARYIKVLIRNYGIIPDGNPGAGSRAWLFVDEIEVK